MLAKIQPSIAAETHTTCNRSSQNNAFVYNVTELNIANTLQHIYQESDILRLLTDKEDIGMVGAIYDVNSGEVNFKDYSSTVNDFGNKKSGQLIDKLQKLIGAASIAVEN